MKKSKSSEPQDRLSELPDSLILLILSFLPMEDVVTTPLLSKRWKDLWTTIPCLNFSDDDSIHSVTFRNFVNRALMLWEGLKIQKFNISFNYYEVDSIYTRADVDLWLRFAIRNKVEELCVNLLNSWDMESGFDNSGCCLAPQRLYSCSSIRKLSLVGCELKIHGNVRWDQLKFLSIAAAPVGENVMDQILSGAPQLEVLILCRTESCENLNVHSSSLKTLKIKRYFAEGDDRVLTICAPNLETFEISGPLYGGFVLMDVSSLTKATIGFDFGQNSGWKLLEDILGQVDRSSLVEKATLSDWLSEETVQTKKKDMLSLLSNAEFLNLYVCTVDELVALLEIFPKLTTLVLRNPETNGDYDIFVEIHCDIREPFVAEFAMESKTDIPKSIVLHLKTVEIAWDGYDDSIFPIVEFLLKYACNLGKLVIRLERSTSLELETLLLTTVKLLRMPRSSPNAEVIFCRK